MVEDQFPAVFKIAKVCFFDLKLSYLFVFRLIRSFNGFTEDIIDNDAVTVRRCDLIKFVLAIGFVFDRVIKINMLPCNALAFKLYITIINAIDRLLFEIMYLPDKRFTIANTDVRERGFPGP